MIEQYYFGGKIPEEYRIFTVVRCPYERFWSEWASRRLPPPNRFPLSFHLSASTLIKLAKQEIPALKDLNSHMRPQCKYLEGVAASRVRILRFESLSTDFLQMQQEWCLPERPLPIDNRSKRRQKPSAKELALGDRFVENHYDEDFSKLGYNVKKVWRVLRKLFGREVAEIATGTLSAMSVKLLAITCVFFMNLIIVRQIGASESGIFSYVWLLQLFFQILAAWGWIKVLFVLSR